LAAGTDDASKADLKKMQGKWKLVSIINDGKAETTVTATWTVSGNKIVFSSNPKGKLQDEFTLDATKDPKAMDIRSIRDKEKPQEFKAIYALQGDELKICVDVSGKGRPTDFESRAGSSCRLITLKRVKE
jgi:uncharacterized protein (TIGR03067 family)